MNPAEPTDAGASAPPDEAQTNEAVKDPATQTEDPAGTQQPTYPEYQDDLSAILKAAGVDDTVIAAPDYEAEVNEESLESVTSIGGDAANKLIRDTETDQRNIDSQEGPVAEDETDEGALGAVAGGALGALAAGPVGAVRGAMVGDKIGDAISSDKEETDESSLQGQYGHSGKLKAVANKPDFLTRLKELSGMIRN
jgi:hypothetical protein